MASNIVSLVQRQPEGINKQNGALTKESNRSNKKKGGGGFHISSKAFWNIMYELHY